MTVTPANAHAACAHMQALTHALPCKIVCVCCVCKSILGSLLFSSLLACDIPRRPDSSCLPQTLVQGEGAAEAAGACGNSATCGLTGLLAVDIPLDGRGPTALPAAEMMSPVFTLWITLAAMYLGAALARDGAHACALRSSAPCCSCGRKGSVIRCQSTHTVVHDAAHSASWDAAQLI